MADKTPARPEKPQPHPGEESAEITFKNGQWTFIGQDGLDYEYNEHLHAWFPQVHLLTKLIDSLIQKQQSIYSVAGVDESVRLITEIPEKPLKLRKPKEQKRKRVQEPKKNTAVYVTGLPEDATVDEMADTFKKAGVILLDPLTDAPKIKLYRKDDGSVKGDALVVYLREESVELACRLFDDMPYRADSGAVIHVQPAVFQQKQSDNQEKDTGKPNTAEKKKKQKVMEKLKKQLEWNEDEQVEKKNPKAARTVVMKHMFTIEELQADPTLLLDLKMDVQLECEKIAPVLEEDGIIVVRFRDAAGADACVMMNGRFFGGQQISASISTGKEKFKATRREDEESQRKREEAYGQWLEEHN